MQKLVVWCNQNLDEPARKKLHHGLRQHELLFDDPQHLLRAHVAFGQPPVEALAAGSTLRLVQLSSAGHTKYDGEDLRTTLIARGVAMTKSSGVFDEPCADHALAFMLCAARALPWGQLQMQGERAWPTDELRRRSFLLRNQNVLIVGYGSIGQRLADRLAPFGARVRGARRQPTGAESVPTTSTQNAEFLRWLGQADHVVNLLPLNAATETFFNADRLARLRPGALFYNIGRGGTVDQLALQKALDAGALAGAYLDVTQPEPLPPSHPLWQTPNCFITPHTAGGHRDEQERLVDLLLVNIDRLISNLPLVDRIL